MALMKMLTLTALGPQEEIRRIARRLVLREDFQPVPVDGIIRDRSLRSALKTSGANPCDSLLRRLEAIWETANVPLPSPTPVPLSAETALDKVQSQVEEALHRLEIWDRRRSQIQERTRSLEAARILMETVEERGQTLEDLTSLERFDIFFGRLPEENLARLDESARDVPLLPMPVASAVGERWLLAFSLPGYREGARKLLESLNFTNFSIDEIRRRFARGGKTKVLTQLEKHRKSLARLTEAAERYVRENADELQSLYNRTFTLQRIFELCRGRGEIGDYHVLSGWIPASARKEVMELVEKEGSRSAAFTEEPPADTAAVPTLLRNLPFVRAFQDIVALYSLPGYGETDPSFMVAVSFCLMFGFMFGDVGHGLLLGIAAGILVHRGLMRRAMGLVVQTAGAFSILFGFLYGSVFGIEDLLPPLWFSPMENMDLLLGISLATGFGFVSFGMALNVWSRWRERDYGTMLFDGKGLAGILFYWTAALALFGAFRDTPPPLPGWLTGLVLGLLLAAMLFRDRLCRLLPGRQEASSGTVVHVFEVFHALFSFLSNTASFVRLAAFTLNHVGLSLAVFMLGDMVRDLPGGLFFRILILLAGNLLIVGLEGLIVFIQTLRLEYYEFFSKFYRGGGDPFRPVRWSRGKQEPPLHSA